MACKSKSVCLLSIIALMIVIPAGLYFVATVIPIFYNSRANLIKEYNKKATIWQNDGIPYFKKASFSVSVGDKTLELQPYSEKFGENYPIRDSCKLERDPSEGCVYTDAFYYRIEIPKEELTELPVLLRNGLEGAIIYNSTYKISAPGVADYDSMGCGSYETCKPKCDAMQGELDPDLKLCRYTKYLNELCYRVNDNNGVYSIDEPPYWDLLYHTGYPGCDYDMAWREDYYLFGRKDTVLLSVRYYQDSYIQASSFTTGCSSTHEEATQCFPTGSGNDVRVNQIVFLLTISALLIAFVEVLGVVIFCISLAVKKARSKKSNTIRLV